jgi:site-specific recombinase XerD
MTQTPPTHAGTKLPPQALTRAELQDLLAQPSRRTPTGIRTRALLGVMSGAGTRLQETLDLYPRDVNTERCTVFVREGKGGESRTVGLDGSSCALVDLWLVTRGKLGLTGRHPLFCTYSDGNKGQPLQQRYVRQLVARTGERAGIDKRVHPHGLRHTLASLMVEAGIPLHVISAQLGHKHTSTTDRYLRDIAPAELLGWMRKFSLTGEQA